MIFSAYFGLLIGSMIIVISYFLYLKYNRAFHTLRILCYAGAFGYTVEVEQEYMGIKVLNVRSVAI